MAYQEDKTLRLPSRKSSRSGRVATCCGVGSESLKQHQLLTLSATTAAVTWHYVTTADKPAANWYKTALDDGQ